MIELDAPLAGERSGHIFVRAGFHGYDDGLFAGLKLAEFVAASEFLPCRTSGRRTAVRHES